MRCSWSMIYGTLQNTPSLNHTSQPTDCTEQVETCHTLLLRFDAPLPVLKTPAFPLDRTRQQHSPQFLITPRTNASGPIPVRKMNSLLQLIVASSPAGGFDRTPSFTSSNRWSRLNKKNYLRSRYSTCWVNCSKMACNEIMAETKRGPNTPAVSIKHTQDDNARRGKRFSLLHPRPDWTWAQPVQRVPAYFPGVKRTGRVVYHSSSSHAEVHTSTPPLCLRASCRKALEQPAFSCTTGPQLCPVRALPPK